MKGFAGALLAVACGMLYAYSVLATSNGEQQPAQSQLVLEQSILTRAIGIEAPRKLVGLLDTMPSAVIPRDGKASKTRTALWSLFFSGSMTKLARIPSPQPFIAFYNPIADVAVIQGCKVDPTTRVMLCTQACAVPGEVLSGEAAGSSPAWLISSDPIGTLQQISGERMQAFGVANPATSPETSFWRRTYCSIENQSTAEKRLISLAMSSGRFDEKRFREGAGHYVAQAMRSGAAQQVGSSKGIADSVIQVLEHLNEMTMSGAIAGAKGRWIIFLSEKQNGWRIAVFNASVEADGTLKIDSARLVSISTHEH